MGLFPTTVNQSPTIWHVANCKEKYIDHVTVPKYKYDHFTDYVSIENNQQCLLKPDMFEEDCSATRMPWISFSIIRTLTSSAMKL